MKARTMFGWNRWRPALALLALVAGLSMVVAACGGSDNSNTMSWTHDSELTAAVVDAERDPRAPTDPGGLGDGARRFARELRLRLMCEHLDLDDEDNDLVDPVRAADIVRKSAAELDAWHDGGRRGPRRPGPARPQRRARGHDGMSGTDATADAAPDPVDPPPFWVPWAPPPPPPPVPRALVGLAALLATSASATGEATASSTSAKTPLISLAPLTT